MNLTQKEKLLLKDQQSHEELCIKKYNNYANQAQASQLKQMFQNFAQQEQQHLNTINQIINGQVPNTASQQDQQQQDGQVQGQQMQSIQKQSDANQNKKDAELCQDMLTTEKYIASTYNTAIFEFSDHNIRNALNHIQKEEQQHGEGIFNYMQSNGMYQTQ